MKIIKLTFPGSQAYPLGARLNLPGDEQPRAIALFAHCFTCTQNLKAASNISRALADRRIATLRFDFTGLGESEGDFADTNFTSNVEDLLAAAEFLGAHYQAPQILIGHSLGGAAVMQAARHIAACQAVVTIAAPSKLDHLSQILLSQQPDIERLGAAEVVIAGRVFKLKKQFLDDLDQNNMQHVIGNLGRALLVLHSPQDDTVSFDNAMRIFALAPHPKSLISLHQADHLLADERDSTYAGALIATWVSRYLQD